MLKTTEDGDFPIRFVRNATSGLKLKVKLIAHSVFFLFRSGIRLQMLFLLLLKEKGGLLFGRPIFSPNPCLTNFHAP